MEKEFFRQKYRKNGMIQDVFNQTNHKLTSSPSPSVYNFSKNHFLRIFVRRQRKDVIKSLTLFKKPHNKKIVYLIKCVYI